MQLPSAGNSTIVSPVPTPGGREAGHQIRSAPGAGIEPDVVIAHIRGNRLERIRLSRLRQRYGAIAGGISLGLMWGVWHLPVLDFMGAATPHGAYFPMFFAAFVATATLVRVLIGVLSHRTGSVALAQLMHTTLTGSLALLSPAGVSPAHEAAWYAVYAVALWLVLAGVAVWRIRPEQNLGLRLRPPSS